MRFVCSLGPVTQAGYDNHTAEGSGFEPQISQKVRIRTEGRLAFPKEPIERAEWNRKTGNIVKGGGAGSAMYQLLHLVIAFSCDDLPRSRLQHGPQWAGVATPNAFRP